MGADASIPPITMNDDAPGRKPPRRIKTVGKNCRFSWLECELDLFVFVSTDDDFPRL